MKIRSAMALAMWMSLGLPAAAEERRDSAPKAQMEQQEKAASAATTTADANAPAPGPVAAPPPQGRRLEYRPPSVGKPARSVGGGSRGVRDRIPLLYALVPDHVGQTTAPQPSLFWFIDELPETPAQVEFTILTPDEVEPFFETVLPAPTKPGVQRIRLSEFDVKLAPGTEYEWSVGLVLDPKDPSKDVVATGWIDRVERPELAGRLDAAGQDGAVYLLAEEGLWYDALGRLGDDLERSPSDTRLRSMQESLLEQVGLGALTKSQTM